MGGNPERAAEYQDAVTDSHVARQVYRLRTEAGLSQRLAAGCPAAASAGPGTAGEPGGRVEAVWAILGGPREGVAK